MADRKIEEILSAISIFLSHIFLPRFSYLKHETPILPIPLLGKHSPTSEHPSNRPRICREREGSGNKALSSV
jgi:hypothetical protein